MVVVVSVTVVVCVSVTVGTVSVIVSVVGGPVTVTGGNVVGISTRSVTVPVTVLPGRLSVRVRV